MFVGDQVGRFDFEGELGAYDKIHFELRRRSPIGKEGIAIAIEVVCTYLLHNKLLEGSALVNPGSENPINDLT